MERTAIIKDNVLVTIMTILVIVMHNMLAKIVKLLIIAIGKTALIMENVVHSTTPMNVLVIPDLLAKTVSMITVSIKHVLIMAGVKTDKAPTHVNATLVTWGKIANVLTVIQINVEMLQRV